MNMTGKYTINAVITITQNTRNCMVVLPEYFGESNITHAQFKYLIMYTGSTMAARRTHRRDSTADIGAQTEDEKPDVLGLIANQRMLPAAKTRC